MTDRVLTEAIRTLGINVPISRVDTLPDGTLQLHLYGGQVKEYRPPTTPDTPRNVDDTLTVVHGIGRVGEANLHEAGIRTYKALAATYTHHIATLAAIFNTASLNKIGAWLDANHYL
jgi:hypothetical protein